MPQNRMSHARMSHACTGKMWAPTTAGLWDRAQSGRASAAAALLWRWRWSEGSSAVVVALEWRLLCKPLVVAGSNLGFGVLCAHLRLQVGHAVVSRLSRIL